MPDSAAFDAEFWREKILSGELPSRVQPGKQRMHIPGTQEFRQKVEKMKRQQPGSMPSKLNDGIDAQMLLKEPTD